MNVASIIMSLQKEMTPPRPEPLFERRPLTPPAPPPLSTHISPLNPPHSARIRPVNIFSLPETRSNPPPPAPALIPIESFAGAFAELDSDIEKEIDSFRAEADRANERALRKQIEALKEIISAQKNL